MRGTHRVLVAAQHRAWRVLETMLSDVGDLVPAHTTTDAFKILERDRFDLIVCTIAFDESQMIEFLQTVKQNSLARDIPFLCTRVLPGVLRDNLVTTMRDACKECGAVDLIDVARLPPDAARDAMRKAVIACVAR
jgi:CheY-like chemotaxis protein